MKSVKKKYNKIKMIDLSERKYVEIIETEHSLVNNEYDRTFKAVNEKIDKKTQEYIRDLEEIIRYKLLTSSLEDSEINATNILHEYNYLIQNKEKNAKIISKFNDYYYSLTDKEKIK